MTLVCGAVTPGVSHLGLVSILFVILTSIHVNLNSEDRKHKTKVNLTVLQSSNLVNFVLQIHIT